MPRCLIGRLVSRRDGRGTETDRKRPGAEAERRVRFRHAAWLKAQRPPAASAARRRTLAELRELAKSASGLRLEREVHLRRLMADVDKHWEAIDVQAKCGSASGYDQAVRALVNLAEGYRLTSSPKEFEHALRYFVVRHATRGTLVRRLTEAGLWSG